MLRSLLLAGAVLVVHAAPACAQSAADSAAPAGDAEQQAGAGAGRRAAPDDGPAIVVTGTRTRHVDVLSGTASVSGEILVREQQPTIGDTLARLPGVSSTSFGPNASRPVLRGFDGDRVKILIDGIGNLDVSGASADHAVSINPLTAERMEVLRGPGALAYGTEAIGGVVNVVDARIPRRVPTEPIQVVALLNYGSAASTRAANIGADVPLGGHFVGHIDGSYSKSDDLHVGGFLLTPALRAQAGASADPAIRALAGLRDTLPNSAGRTWDIAAGAAWINGNSNIGLSVGHYASLYGVPIRYSLDPAITAEAPRIDIAQTRVDGRAEIDTGTGFIDAVHVRAGYANYRHFELAQDGAIGTAFYNKGFEGRAEALQSTRGGWGGSFGAQYFRSDLRVAGDEKFLPQNSSRNLGLFILETLDRGAVRAEGALRYDRSKLHADADTDLGNGALDRRFDALSAAVGVSYAVASNLRIGLNLSRSARTPDVEELFANGPHAGTQAFEVGDPGLTTERSWGAEATLRRTGEAFSFSASIFKSWFGSYIYDRQTGQVRDNLPVFQTSQGRASYAGAEIEATARIAQIGATSVNLDGVADYVRATIDGVGPAPRIPPLRLMGGIEAQSQGIDGRVEVERVTSQNRIAALETPTPGYTLVNASLSLHPFGARNQSSIVLSANNIFDVVARRHASFLKDYAPLVGRDLRVSLRAMF